MTKPRNSSKQNTNKQKGNQKVSKDEMCQNESKYMRETSEVLKLTRETIFNENAGDDILHGTSTRTQNTQNTIQQERGDTRDQINSPQPVSSGQQCVTNVNLPPDTPIDSTKKNIHFNVVQPTFSNPDSSMPIWAANMCQQLNIIQGTLENQNRRWQSMAEKLQTQNARMSNIESKLVNLHVLEQNITTANKNIEHVQREMQSMKQKVTDYDNTIQQYSNICDDMITNNTGISQQVNEIFKKMKQIEVNQEIIQKSQIEAKDKIVDLQWRSMRENLIISGLPETERDENCENIICEFIKNNLDIHEEIKFDRVHRLGKFIPNRRHPRPIVAKFTNFKDKERVKALAPFKLRNTNIYVNDQYPQEIEQKRKQLYPIAREARRNPHNKVKLIKDKLYINGVLTEPQHTAAYEEQTRSYANMGSANVTHNRETHTRRKYTRREDSVDTIRSGNRFSLLGSVSDGIYNTPRPPLHGKKKAVSPLDSDMAAKKIKDGGSEDESNSENDETMIETENIQEHDSSHLNADRQQVDCDPASEVQSRNATD